MKKRKTRQPIKSSTKTASKNIYTLHMVRSGLNGYFPMSTSRHRIAFFVWWNKEAGCGQDVESQSTSMRQKDNSSSNSGREDGQ